MQQRTEEQKLVKSPVLVTFGDQQYEIKPLVIKKAQIWRRKFIETINETSGLSKVLSDNPEEFEKAMLNVLLDKPEKMIDLFFDYADNLSREEIENKASSNEMIDALQEVIALESPFFGVALRVMTTMRKNILP